MIEYILNSEEKGRILKFLFARHDWIFSQSEIARELKIPKTTAQRALKALAEQNIIREIKKKGKINIYQLNKKNYIVRDLLEPLFEKEEKIIMEKSKQFCQKLKNAMKNKNFQNVIKAVILFGSAAHGEMKPISDVDLAIITKDNLKPAQRMFLLKAVEKTRAEFLEKDSIIFSAQYFSKSEFDRRSEWDSEDVDDNGEIISKDPYIRSIYDGGIFVFGDIDEVL